MSFLSLKERYRRESREGERERRKEGRERRKNVCVNPHPCGLEPVNTFAEPIIKFSPLVVGVRIQTE